MMGQTVHMGALEVQSTSDTWARAHVTLMLEGGVPGASLSAKPKQEGVTPFQESLPSERCRRQARSSCSA